MTRKAATKPRKSASQALSRQTVDALLEATARVLIKEGYDKTSTNKIAAVAGVSIGSLYQYFPSKEALVAAVIDLHMHEMFRVVRDALVKVATRPIEVAARELVSVMIEAHRINPNCTVSWSSRRRGPVSSKTSRPWNARLTGLSALISRPIEMSSMLPIRISLHSCV